MAIEAQPINLAAVAPEVRAVQDGQAGPAELAGSAVQVDPVDPAALVA